MSGVRRMIVGELSHSNLRGKALSDALYAQLNSQEKATSSLKKEVKKG